MAIFQFQQQPDICVDEAAPVAEEKKDRWFSSVVTRLFFGLLLLADCLWGLFALALFAIGLLSTLATCGHSRRTLSLIAKSFLMLRRCLVCGLSLLVGLFSPAFGIMVACTYFLMYDKKGIEEVVPASLQGQFHEMFAQR